MGRITAAAAIALFVAGAGTASIASVTGVGQRRIQQLVAGVQTAQQLPVPSEALFAAMVMTAVAQHGHNYGTIMLQGALRAAYPVYSFPRRKIAALLQTLYPNAWAARRSWAHRKLERGHYHAPWPFYSVHLDLDCKLQEYGLFVGAMIDGHSRLCGSLVALTTKLPYVVYSMVYLPFVAAHGIPDQLITDKGTEWSLIVFVSHLIAALFSQATRAAHRFVTSTRNIRVEKFNYEINMRILLPIRLLINDLERAGMLSKYDPVQVLAFAHLMRPLMQVGLDRLKRAWNEHTVKAVPGRPGTGGRPSKRASNPRPSGCWQLPAGFDGVVEYQKAMGTSLQRVADGVAADLRLRPPHVQQQRAAAAAAVISDVVVAWDEIVAGQYGRFVQAYVVYCSF